MTTDGHSPRGSPTRVYRGGPPPAANSDRVVQIGLYLQECGIRILPTYGLRRSAGSYVCQCLNGSKKAESLGLPPPTCVNGPGKHPRVPAWPQAATTDPAVLLTWYRRWPKTNLSALCGRASGIWVLDIDGAQGFESLACLEAELGPLPPTWRTQSGSGTGRHYWFSLPSDTPEIGNSAGTMAPKIDVRGKGGQILIPGCLHRSGGYYRWEDGFSPTDVDLAVAPAAWTTAALNANTKTAAKATVRPPRHRRDHLATISAHTPGSKAIGDGPGRGGFHAPINKLLVEYFRELGTDADEQPVLTALREAIAHAPVADHASERVQRYLSDEYLSKACASARRYIMENAQ
jgi:hypothetical protein